MSTKLTSSTADAISEVKTLPSAQCETPEESVPALDSPYTSSATPPVPVMAPGRSNRPRWREDSASTYGATRATRIPMGTLTNSTQRQDR